MMFFMVVPVVFKAVGRRISSFSTRRFSPLLDEWYYFVEDVRLPGLVEGFHRQEHASFPCFWSMVPLRCLMSGSHLLGVCVALRSTGILGCSGR